MTDILSPERWAVVARNPLYEVSDHGRVRSNARGKSRYMLSPGRATGGHFTVALGRGNSVCVHVLVAEAFLPAKPSPKHEVRHKDGVHGNNFHENLEWSTRRRNSQDKKYHAGQTNYKLKPAQVEEIKFAQQFPYHGQGVDLAAEFKVSEHVISAIKHGRIHADVE